MKKSILSKRRSYPIGYISQRKDGAYRKIEDGEWIPIKSRSAIEKSTFDSLANQYIKCTGDTEYDKIYSVYDPSDGSIIVSTEGLQRAKEHLRVALEKYALNKSLLIKSKKYPIGYISQRKDGAYKKVADGKWVPISEKDRAKKPRSYHKAKLNVTHAIADIYEDIDYKLSLGKYDDNKKLKSAVQKLHLYLGETIHGILTRTDITRDELANAFVNAGYKAKYANSMIRGVKPMKKSLLIKSKKYPIGHISQRKDGAYKKVAEGKWVPVKNQSKKKQSSEKKKSPSDDADDDIFYIKNITKEYNKQYPKDDATRAYYYPNVDAIVTWSRRGIQLSPGTMDKKGKIKPKKVSRKNDYSKSFGPWSQLGDVDNYIAKIAKKMNKSLYLMRKAVDGVKVEVSGQEMIDGLIHRIIHHRTKLEHLEHPDNAKLEANNSLIDPSEAPTSADFIKHRKEEHKRRIEEFQAIKKKIDPKKTYLLTPYEFTDYVSEFYDG